MLDRLTDLLLYIEPDGPGLNTYGLKTRELLVLAATDVEDMLARYLQRAELAKGSNGYTTNHYVRLLSPLHLSDFQFAMAPYPSVPPVRPFYGWDSSRPTQSLGWYDAYNKTKHDKSGALSAATLGRCVEAVAASLAMFCVRFSPYPLFSASTPVASLAQHLLNLELVDPAVDSFYVPLLDIPPNHRDEMQCFDSHRMQVPWQSVALASLL